MDPASNSHQHQAVGGLPPPPGVVPDFSNPTLGYVVASVAVCLSITTLVVWIRMYTVFRVIKLHGWADCKYLLTAANWISPLPCPWTSSNSWQTHPSLRGYAILCSPVVECKRVIDHLQLGFLGFCSSDIAGMHWGGGSHQWNVTLSNLIRLLKVLWPLWSCQSSWWEY